jgi:hypothetical protein
MTRVRKARSPRAALLDQPWSGFRTAAEIAGAYDRWSLATISDQLFRLSREGLIWSVRHEGETSVHKFAHPSLEVDDLVIPGPRSPLRRSWQTLQQARRIAVQAVEMPLVGRQA